MENKCKNCKYNCSGKCNVPVWDSGSYYSGIDTSKITVCGLFESKDTK